MKLLPIFRSKWWDGLFEWEGVGPWEPKCGGKFNGVTKLTSGHPIPSSCLPRTQNFGCCRMVTNFLCITTKWINSTFATSSRRPFKFSCWQKHLKSMWAIRRYVKRAKPKHDIGNDEDWRVKTEERSTLGWWRWSVDGWKSWPQLGDFGGWWVSCHLVRFCQRWGMKVLMKALLGLTLCCTKLYKPTPIWTIRKALLLRCWTHD